MDLALFGRAASKIMLCIGRYALYIDLLPASFCEILSFFYLHIRSAITRE